MRFSASQPSTRISMAPVYKTRKNETVGHGCALHSKSHLQEIPRWEVARRIDSGLIHVECGPVQPFKHVFGSGEVPGTFLQQRQSPALLFEKAPIKVGRDRVAGVGASSGVQF